MERIKILNPDYYPEPVVQILDEAGKVVDHKQFSGEYLERALDVSA